MLLDCILCLLNNFKSKILSSIHEFCKPDVKQGRAVCVSTVTAYQLRDRYYFIDKCLHCCMITNMQCMMCIIKLIINAWTAMVLLTSCNNVRLIVNHEDQ